jgi:diguanylate cyclase (GGDEF)-like protein
MPLFSSDEPIDRVTDALAEALDRFDVGIVLLNADLTVRFVNRRLLNLWGLPADLPHQTRTWRAMIEHAASRGVPDLPFDSLVRRESERRAGIEQPTAIEHVNGLRLAVDCVMTRDGGRMLTYTDVTHSEREHKRQQDARDAAERLEADLRFSNATLESQAVYLASLAEAADDAARKADQAKRHLEREIAERLQLEAELRRLATTDTLTATHNRAHLLALGNRELRRAQDLGQDLAVVMLDVDHFKAINDRYGHAGGDAALRHLTERLRHSLRQIDLLGRFGGEEFAVILPMIQHTAALVIAERLRATVAASPARHDTGDIQFTISLGVAMARASDSDLDCVLARADAALYAAKRDGRNRVRVAEG